MKTDRPGFTGPDLCRLTACEALDALAARQVSAHDLVEASLARIEQTGPAINAMVTTCPDRARAAASALPPATLLAGLPVGIKDLTPVAGVRTTWGTQAFADHVPEESHPLVERMEDRGAIVIGKTNTPELGAGANTFNAIFGPTRNPWDTRQNAGGSSGGAAAGLATGEVWLSHGSDLGGSLRTPAAYCGIVGLRPSPGVAWGGPATNAFDSMPVQGPMARNVEDCALFLDAMTGCDPRAPLSWPAPATPYRDTCRQVPGEVRIAFSHDLGGLAPIEPAMEQALRDAVGRIDAGGLPVEETAPPSAGTEDIFRTLRAFGFWVDARETPEDVTRHYKATLRQNIAEGRALDADTVADAHSARTRLYAAMADFMTHHDVLAGPVVGLFPLPVETEYPPSVNGHDSRDYLDWLRFAMLATLCSLPAMSIPVGFNAQGLPVGLQLIGRPRGEGRLLQIARRIEEILALDLRPIDPRVTHA
ncbi:amidase [Citreimonas salinaria]|uniref:Amidase n=1 Tax=Citreimonas salinaria TaxID=321339 RepID=A0A1H3J957_9RHOB|nr:amidase family protein [Citreimonas salinaria]SDY36109.1 amidase [Citreimonas salinaria]